MPAKCAGRGIHHKTDLRNQQGNLTQNGRSRGATIYFLATGRCSMLQKHHPQGDGRQPGDGHGSNVGVRLRLPVGTDGDFDGVERPNGRAERARRRSPPG